MFAEASDPVSIIPYTPTPGLASPSLHWWTGLSESISNKKSVVPELLELLTELSLLLDELLLLELLSELDVELEEDLELL